MAKRILVIDDAAKIVDFIRRGLIYEGYIVDVAYDGQSGLEQAEREPPDLVMLDVMMPGLDGLEVCRQLRASPNGDVPILMLTAKDAVPTGWQAWTQAPTTIWSSPLPSMSCWPASAPCSAAARLPMAIR